MKTSASSWYFFLRTWSKKWQSARQFSDLIITWSESSIVSSRCWIWTQWASLIWSLRSDREQRQLMCRFDALTYLEPYLVLLCDECNTWDEDRFLTSESIVVVLLKHVALDWLTIHSLTHASVLLSHTDSLFNWDIILSLMRWSENQSSSKTWGFWGQQWLSLYATSCRHIAVHSFCIICRGLSLTDRLCFAEDFICYVSDQTV